MSLRRVLWNCRRSHRMSNEGTHRMSNEGTHPSGKADKGDNYMEDDRISQLPDETLVSILSLLTMKEATATSVLSTRWRYLWTCVTSLNFDAPDMVDEIFNDIDRLSEVLEINRSRYVSCVNQVCSSIRAQMITEFRICFDLNSNFKNDIDRWVEFALITKSTQKFELNLLPCQGYVGHNPMFYAFSDECCSLIKSPRGSSGIRSLKSLNLHSVHINKELLEHFLLNCPFLEQLSVVFSLHLRNLKVVGESLQLRVLEISQCFRLSSLEISAPNLISFEFHGLKIGLNIKNAPLLTNISLNVNNRETIAQAFQSISSHLFQLTTLQLRMDLIKENMKFPLSLKLTSLKELMFTIYCPSPEDSILGLTSFIQQSPFIKKLTLKLHICHSRKSVSDEAIVCSHQYLEILEIIGFIGCQLEVEFIRHIFKIAVVLKKVILRPFNLVGIDDEFGRELSARQSAELLRAELPEGVELLVL